MNQVFAWREAPPADFAVIGDPVSHTLSPKMHQAAYDALRLPFHYVAIQVPRGEVPSALDHLSNLGYRGVNVTVPHKEEALNWCKKREPVAERLRAANTIRFRDRSCINTDLPGFWDTIAEVKLPTNRVLVLGAGGSARSVVLALVQRSFDVSIWNRTPENAKTLIESLGVTANKVSAPCVQRAGLIVNTTSASLQGESLPVAWTDAAPGALAYDLMYMDGPTPFLAEALHHGFQTMDGRPLLAAQGARSLEYWLDMKAPRDVMLKAIERLEPRA